MRQNMKVKIYETLKSVFHKYRDCSNQNIDYENAKMILKEDKNSILLDVRSPQEYKEGHLACSINLPLYDIEEKCEKVLKSKEDTIVLYCQSGSRSKRALENLKKQGYLNLYQIEGGLDNIK